MTNKYHENISDQRIWMSSQ